MEKERTIFPKKRGTIYNRQRYDAGILFGSFIFLFVAKQTKTKWLSSHKPQRNGAEMYRFFVLKNKKAVVIWGNCKSSSLYPPVSVFDTKQGYWQKRKREWKALGLQSDAGRKEGLLGNGMKELAEKYHMNLTGTSIFDPVLCEVIYKWFSPVGGIVYDPFAGGSVRGVVAEYTGRKYIGIDLSERQVDANQINADRLGVCPVWYCDDSRNADRYIEDGSADLVFSCPPYHNLEQYSDHPLDLSNMNYEDFLEAYGEIIRKACAKLKENRFAVFVVGDIRDRKGAYRDFISTTKSMFQGNGLSLYNEIILLEQYGTAPMRAGVIFKAKRKVTKVHQNVLVFYKGDIKGIEPETNHFTWEDLREGEGNVDPETGEILPKLRDQENVAAESISRCVPRLCKVETVNGGRSGMQTCKGEQDFSKD